VCPQVRHLQYKVRQVQYKISEITGICRGCTLPVFTWKYPANAWICRSNCCFFVLFVSWPVGTGYGCSLLVASNVFVRTKPYLLILNKNNAPHECGNPKCKAIALLLAIGRTISSWSSTSAGCFACKQEGKARSRRASAANAELHQLACVVPGDAPS